MVNNKKAPASVCETRAEAANERGFTMKDYTGFLRKNQGFIYSILPHGEENAVSTRDLIALTGYRTARQLQKQIEAERAAGALILSASTGGYYLPAAGAAGRIELLRYERTLRNRAINTLRTLKAARRALRELEGQLKMGEVD